MQMQDIFGSVRRSLVFHATPENEEALLGGTLVEKINSCIRKSRVFSKPSPASRPMPSVIKESSPMIRWRKGELIGCSAFGRVYLGMNVDSGELLAVKQVLIVASSASKENAQAPLDSDTTLLEALDFS